MNIRGSEGWSMETIGKIVIILVGAIIMFVGLFGLEKIAYAESDVEACRTSVALAAVEVSVDPIGNSGIKPFEKALTCSTHLIEIEDTYSREEVKEIIYQEMVNCFTAYGQGKIDFIPDFDVGSTDYYCYVCSRIKTKSQNDFTISNQELITYLQNKKFKDGLNFFQKTGINSNSISGFKLSSSQDLDLVYKAYKTGFLEEDFNFVISLNTELNHKKDCDEEDQYAVFDYLKKTKRDYDFK